MKRIGDRLARLKPGVGTPSPVEDHTIIAPADSTGITESKATNYVEHPDSVARLRRWSMMPTPYGEAHVYRKVTPCPSAPPTTDVATRMGDPRLQGFRADRALYLDIEATGLSHGAGTFAFLIGCAYYEESPSGLQLVLEQLFMTGPENEMPVLAYFLKLLYRFEYLVSFNGKSYDLSVLQNRLILNRLLSPQEGHIKLRPHLDLLHACRLPYAGVFANTKLQTLEREVLRMPPETRADDVPGSLVPSLYFHYLRTGYASVLDVVLTHNRTDVLSMVDLTTHLLDLLEEPIERLHPKIAYNLGRASLRFKQPERAAALFSRAIESERLDLEDHYQAMRHAITATRRANDYDAAATYTEDLALALEEQDPKECARLLQLALRYRRKATRGAEPH